MIVKAPQMQNCVKEGKPLTIRQNEVEDGDKEK